MVLLTSHMMITIHDHQDVSMHNSQATIMHGNYVATMSSISLYMGVIFIIEPFRCNANLWDTLVTLSFVYINLLFFLSLFGFNIILGFGP